MDRNGGEHMATLSVVIPAWSVTPELTWMVQDLCYLLRPMCDELVLSEDGNYSEESEQLADIYLHHKRLGHSGNLKEGIRAARGDFIAILDSDIKILNGTIRDLCVPGVVVSPTWANQPDNRTINGWFMVGPHEVFRNPLPPVTEVEGIDLWCNDILQKHRATFQYSDKVEYLHARNTSYTHYSTIRG